jgi:hypothetical protein
MRIIYLFLLFIITFSCKSPDTTLYEFDQRTLVENKITLSDIADEITYIPLDNRFPIGLIYNYKIIHNSIYLSAKDIGVMTFDRNGRLLRKIGNIGRGPGEYKFCFLFTVDDKKETIFVSGGTNTIKVYSKTGEFLRSTSPKRIEGDIDIIASYNSRLFISFFPQFGNAECDWIMLDTLGNEIKKKERSIPRFTSGWGLSGGTYKFEDRLFF